MTLNEIIHWCAEEANKEVSLMREVAPDSTTYIRAKACAETFIFVMQKLVKEMEDAQ